MKEKLEDIQQILENLVIQISALKAQLQSQLDQETIIIPKEDFKKLKLIRKKDDYLLFDFKGVGLVIGTSGTKKIKEDLLSGKLKYLVLEKKDKPSSWYSFKVTHRVLSDEEAALKVLYPYK